AWPSHEGLVTNVATVASSSGSAGSSMTSQLTYFPSSGGVPLAVASTVVPAVALPGAVSVTARLAASPDEFGLPPQCQPAFSTPTPGFERSEERRVGKEWRSRRRGGQ